MPITDVQYDNGIYYCREFGEIDEADARHWVRKAREFVDQSDPQPIVALIDARDVTHITPDARTLLASATVIDGLELAVVVTQNYNSREAAEDIDKNAIDPHTLTFQKMPPARQFAESKADQLREEYQVKTH